MSPGCLGSSRVSPEGAAPFDARSLQALQAMFSLKLRVFADFNDVSVALSGLNCSAIINPGLTPLGSAYVGPSGLTFG